MSGSGPTIFGIFSDKKKAEDCYEILSSKYSEVYLCEPSEFGVIEI